MYPLFPFYVIACLFVLIGINMRDVFSRAVVRTGCWASMSVILFGVIFREISGDTFRYAVHFLHVQRMPLTAALAEARVNWLFIVFEWLVGQISSNPFVFNAFVALICVYLLYDALRKMLDRTNTAIAIFLYSAYPFWLAYVSNTIKQGLAMACLMQAYVAFYRREQIAWFWLFIAPFFHAGALLVYPFIFFHLVLWQKRVDYKRIIMLSLLILAVSIVLSITNLSKPLLAPVQDMLNAQDQYQYSAYFLDTGEINYRVGFRLDFTLFSLTPLVVAYWFYRAKYGLRLEVSGWWINLYILLISLYQLFSFAPFADRFAGFGWYLIPLILMVMISEMNSRKMVQYVLIVFVLFNVFVLRFYSGSGLRLGI